MLEKKGFQVEGRGIVEVKGKGQMETYFVLGKRFDSNAIFVRQPSQSNSLAAVVYTMVQARRKQTIKRTTNTCECRYLTRFFLRSITYVYNITHSTSILFQHRVSKSIGPNLNKKSQTVSAVTKRWKINSAAWDYQIEKQEEPIEETRPKVQHITILKGEKK